MHPRPNSAPSQTDGHAHDETVRSAHNRLFGYRPPAPARRRMPRGSSRRSPFPLCALCARACKQYMEDQAIRLPSNSRSTNPAINGWKNRSFAEWFWEKKTTFPKDGNVDEGHEVIVSAFPALRKGYEILRATEGRYRAPTWCRRHSRCKTIGKKRTKERGKQAWFVMVDFFRS